MPAVKLDENVPDSVGAILRDAGHDIAFARDEGLSGVPDPRVLAVASEEGRVLVSFDRGFTNVVQFPPDTTAGRGRLWVLDESKLRIWPRGSSPTNLD